MAEVHVAIKTIYGRPLGIVEEYSSTTIELIAGGAVS
jgi:hypothetical protein